MVYPVGFWVLALLASANMAHGHVDTQLAVSAHEAAGVDSVTSKLAAAPIIPRWPRLGHLSAVILHEGNDPARLYVARHSNQTVGSNHHYNNMEGPGITSLSQLSQLQAPCKQSTSSASSTSWGVF